MKKVLVDLHLGIWWATINHCFLEMYCMAISKWVWVKEAQDRAEKQKTKKRRDRKIADRELLASLTAAVTAIDPSAILLEFRDQREETLQELEIHVARFGKRILLFVDHDRRDGTAVKVDRDLSVYDLVAVTGATRDNALGFHLRGCDPNQLADVVEVKPKKTRRRDRCYFTRRIDFAAMKPVNLVRRIAAAQ
jgi:hypothetical protein